MPSESNQDATLSRHPELKMTMDLSIFSMLPILDRFYEGVIITDAEGRVRYMNETQAKIDDLDVNEILGKRVNEIYRVDDGVSPTLQCLRTGEPIENLACFYRTHLGRVVNSIHNIFPLVEGGEIKGSIGFIREYASMDESIENASVQREKRDLQTFGLPKQAYEKQSYGNGTRFVFDEIIGSDHAFLQAVHSARMAAGTPSPIMLYGETGTGKELFAQSIHNHGERRRCRYVAVNCAAIPENLLEGILFGTSKGAFTGAMEKAGLFEKANGGTLLLDEVNSMPIGLQAKLLRTLQEKKVRRVGSLKEIDIDVKIISSTNEPLHVACNQGRFRRDLLYRLGVVFIQIPPLRHRKIDLESLIAHFLHKCNQFLNKEINTISSEVMERFYSYHWPGNVRELEHVIEGAMNMLGEKETIGMEHLSVHISSFAQAPHHPSSPVTHPNLPPPLSGEINPFWVVPKNDRYHATIPQESDTDGPDAHEKKESEPTDDRLKKPLAQIQIDNEIGSIRSALEKSRGNGAKAARSLGISPQLLHYKLKRYGIDKTAFKPGKKSASQ